MASPPFIQKTNFLLLLILTSLSLYLTEKPNSVVKEEAPVLSYHNGPLLTGNLSLSIIWYGHFSPLQKSTLTDFIDSLNNNTPPTLKPTVSSWWKAIEKYQTLVTPKPNQDPQNKNFDAPSIQIQIHQQTHLRNSHSNRGKPLRKPLTQADISRLSSEAYKNSSVVVIFTADDVAVEGFCTSWCMRHGSPGTQGVYLWVGNSATQCPGKCAWPFYKPVYGPPTPPLVPPNGDVGADGMVINLASGLAAAVTNPFSTGVFEGPASAPLEAASACPGAFGKGAYPGYIGEVLMDTTTSASYNAQGVNGRKFLLPAIWDPITSACWTLV